MRLTKQAEYAVRIMLELAGASVPGTLASSEIAKRSGVPEKFLRKTVQLLARSGLVESKRGSGGGIKLAVSPEEITVAAVIGAVEGRFALSPCLTDTGYCKNAPSCSLRALFGAAQEALLSVLEGETIAGLAGQK